MASKKTTLKQKSSTPNLVTGKPGVLLLDAAPPEGKTHLRVRNVANHMLVVPANRYSEGQHIFLVAWEEDILALAAWGKDRYLRQLIEAKQLAVGWATEAELPLKLPNLDSAPDDTRSTEDLIHREYDRTYALGICLNPDTKTALEQLRVDVIDEDTQRRNVRFMRGRMDPILRLVKWLEPQIQNRRPILAAVDKRLADIRVM